jgi:hypothetical protein
VANPTRASATGDAAEHLTFAAHHVLEAHFTALGVVLGITTRLSAPKPGDFPVFRPTRRWGYAHVHLNCRFLAATVDSAAAGHRRTVSI